jgi:AMP-polyphosphate phosphotransferase
MKAPSLSALLSDGPFPSEPADKAHDRKIRSLQLKMLRIQQALYHRGRRVIVALEGFDAAGKGGAIQRLTETLDPRGLRVYPIGPPAPDEQRTHWLYRFWRRLPHPGTLAVFDRTWYGRVLVERVDRLIRKPAWRRAYREINEFERQLRLDGVTIIKLFLAISKDEQLRRFRARLADPYKRWKLTEDDLRARAAWDDYVEAADELFRKTSKKRLPWHLIAADDKHHARRRVLEIVTETLDEDRSWMEHQATEQRRTLSKQLADLEKRAGNRADAGEHPKRNA